MDGRSAHIALGAGSPRRAPIVLRVYADDSPGEGAVVLVEIPLGVDWAMTSGSAPAWATLANRADTALADLGYVRSVEWRPHVYPRPIAATKINTAVPRH
jgi:hypothetical protein